MKKIWVFIFLIQSLSSNAQSLRVAVAANAQQVMKVLKADFERTSGIKIELISGSSGKLTSQIKNGAPFDLFFSADLEYPKALYEEGFSIGPPRVYALGSLIICSTTKANITSWKTSISTNTFNKVSIANPLLAPYGKASEQVLRKYKLWDKLKPKLVFGESIAQTNTYLSTGSTDIGFTSEAFVHEYPNPEKLEWLRIDNKAYTKIEQGMIILNHARTNNLKSAQEFFKYVQTKTARQTFKRFGYRLP